MALATTKSAIKKDYSNLNVCIVGQYKVGKSTFAANLGEGVYIASLEAGYHFQEVLKSDISSWNDFENLVNDLTSTKHDFKHLVIDVADILYQYAEDEICKRNKVDAINLLPFGSGYKATKKLFMTEMLRINNLGMGITFVTHEKLKEIKKDSITWTAVCTSLPSSAEESILGMCDLILYAYIDKANQRMMRTKSTKYIHAAGDRSGKLPEVMPLDPKLLMEKLNEFKKS